MQNDLTTGSVFRNVVSVSPLPLRMPSASIAQAAGGGDKKRTASAIGNTVTLFMLLSLALTALLLALRGGIVSIMSTPEEAFQQMDKR